MGLRDRILADMKSAMKAKNMPVVQALKLVHADCKNQEIALKSELNDAQVTAVLKKQVKQYEESLEQYQKSGRVDDGARLQQQRLDLIKSYLPKALSEEDLNSLVEQVMEELKPSSLKEMGAVIKTVQARAGGAVDNRRLAELIKERLQAL